MPEPEGEITIRPPTVADGATIYRLVVESATLDVNSCYAYLLLCRDFADTCRVADAGDGRLGGFLTAYRPPRRRDALFVWQIAVDPGYRRRGIARRLVQDLLESPACDGVTAIEATVSPSNTASRALFERLASQLGSSCQVSEAEGFPAEAFGGAAHEPEPLIRIPLAGAAGRAESA